MDMDYKENNIDHIIKEAQDASKVNLNRYKNNEDDEFMEFLELLISENE